MTSAQLLMPASVVLCKCQQSKSSLPINKIAAYGVSTEQRGAFTTFLVIVDRQASEMELIHYSIGQSQLYRIIGPLMCYI